MRRIDGTFEPNYRFSDEREWRYVPPASEAKVIEILKEYDTTDKRKAVNDRISYLRLDFTPDDISYIIINKENELSDFVHILKDSKKTKYTDEQIERLMTRLITTEQIFGDF